MLAQEQASKKRWQVKKKKKQTSGIQKAVAFRRVEARDLTKGFQTKLDKFMKQLM